jgi:glycosyltransferase involved in cell wall biosynthesis
MTILILNWKDIKNPTSGGAEVLTHEMAKRFVTQGHKVILFASHFSGSPNKEVIDGIKIIRSGRPDLRAFGESVHFKAYKYYQKEGKGKVDVIIDEVHGLPFFAKFYAKEKVIALICEVADDIWFRMFSFPWNLIGWILERIYLLLYKNVPVLTISESTKNELIKCHIPSEKITVLPMGISRVRIKKAAKEKKPTIIFVGRLNKMKGIVDAIMAVTKASKKIKHLQLWVVGKGEEDFMKHLKSLASKKKISATFYDFVSQQEKFELMRRAHAIVVPSVREGFGLIVPEAGSVGTPAVVYDVHGLRDIVRNDINGIKVKKTPHDLARGIERIFVDKKKYAVMCEAAKEESKVYNWDKTARVALEVLAK